MIDRTLQRRVTQALAHFPVVGLLGPRQVGKTTLAKTVLETCRAGAVYLDLELPSDVNKLREPELYLSGLSDSLVILDEIQRVPGLFPVLRGLVDQKRIPDRFLLLGSVSPELIRHSSESLAGRIAYFELSPFTLSEVGDPQRLWLRGGYPESFLASDEQRSFAWREAFVRTFLEQDIPQLGVRVPSLQLRRFWTMMAHAHGSLWNGSRIAGSLGLSAPTVRRYLDLLEAAFVLRQLQPYAANVGKRLTRSPKVYVRDAGLLHALLGLRSREDLLGHPAAGASWEGFVIEQIAAALPPGRQVYFYRTAAGAEMDLAIVEGGRPVAAVEVKRSLSPALGKGFWNAFRDLGCTRGYVVYPGTESYPLAEGVMALPLEQIGDIGVS